MSTTLLLSLTLLGPQAPPSGVLADRPIVVTHMPDAGSGQQNPYDLYKLPPGPDPVTPQLLAEEVPVFARSLLFSPLQNLDIRLGGFSRGSSRIPVNTQGVLDVPAGAWAFLSYALNGDATYTELSRYYPEASGPGGIGGDVFTCWMPGSEVEIEGDYVSIVEKMRDGLMTGVSQITGLDQHLDGYTMAPFVAGDIEEESYLYFTIHPDDLQYVPLAWFSDGVRSSATVLYVRWDVDHWTGPATLVTWDKLNLTEVDEITALAVDNLNHSILYSTSSASACPLLVAVFPNGFAAEASYADPFLRPGGGTVAGVDLGLVAGQNLTGLCSDDPRPINGLDPAGEFVLRTLGIPFAGISGPFATRDLNIACFRTNDPVFGDTVRAILRPEGGSPIVDTAMLYRSTGTIPTLLATFRGSNSNQATPFVFDYPLNGLPGLGAIDMDFFWVVSYRIGGFATSYQVRIRY